MQRFLYVIVCIVLMGVPAKSDEKVLEHPQFKYKNAYAMHVSTKRPMIVVLGAKWCPPCRKYKKKVLEDLAEDIIEGKSQYLLAIVDIDEEPNTQKVIFGGDKETIPYTAGFYFVDGESMKTSFYKYRDKKFVKEQMELIDKVRDK